MATPKGVSGNPGGRPKSKPWTEALRLCANDTDATGKKRLRTLAERTFEAAMEGDMQAVKEIGNRLEGTPIQSVEMETGDNLAALLAKVAGATRGLPSDDSE